MATNDTKALLSANKKALAFLHHACGFDFQKDYFIFHGVGRFTFNSVNKIVSENVSGSCKIALLIKGGKSWNNNLNFVTLGHGKFKPTRHDNIKYWNYDVDYFFSIGSFEEARKNNTEDYFIIAQKMEYLSAPKPETNIDLSQRFKYIPKPYEKAGDGHGKTWISNITLRFTNGSTKDFEYKPFENRYSKEEVTDNVNEIIDKSGYLIIERHRELKHLAHRLRAERAQTAASMADYTEKEDAIYKGIEDAKKRLSNKILAVSSYEGIDAIETAIRKLRWCFFDMELHEKDRAGNRYSSIEGIESRLSNVENKLKEI